MICFCNRLASRVGASTIRRASSPSCSGVSWLFSVAGAFVFFGGFTRLQLQHPLGVFVEKFSFDSFGGREAADVRDDLRALAAGAATESGVAIGAEHQFVLMPFEECAGVSFVARVQIETRT